MVNATNKGYKLAFRLLLIFSIVMVQSAFCAEDYETASRLFAEKRYIESKEILTELANSGNSPAQNLLGRMYFFGFGTEPNYDESFRWRLEAATNEYPEAQYQVAGMYLYGYGVEKSVNKSIYWLTKATSHEYAPAANLLGQLYEDPNNGYRDLCKAAKWYKASTELGDPLGYYLLNNLLFTNDGVKCH